LRMPHITRTRLLASSIALLLVILVLVMLLRLPASFPPSAMHDSKQVAHSDSSGALQTDHTTPSSVFTNYLNGGKIPAQPGPTPTPTLAPTSTPMPTPTSAPAATSSASAGNTPAPVGNNTNTAASFSLIFSDDFNGTTLDPTWGTYGGPHGGGQSYYDPSEVQVSGGLLHVSMERKTTGGLPYTTGGLAAFKLAQIYGKYELRAKLPHGKGVGPYTILWPNAAEPNTAQVDLFESPPVNKTTVYFTNHGVDGTSTQLTANGNFADDFHTFTYEWTPGKLRFLVDGTEVGVLTKSVPDFSMWFGIAVSSGDAFTGLPDPTTVLPVSLDVDWVHIYKYNG